MGAFESWESYLYPETIRPDGTGTLRNLFGERDARVLQRLEYAATAIRGRELLEGSAPIERSYGAEHLKAIHAYLFQDVYEWAGEYRSVNMSKIGDVVPFADARGPDIGEILDEVQRYARGVDWAELDGDRFVVASAAIFSYVNQSHPFRDGNGRAAKVFLGHLAEQSGFTFDFSRVDRHWWNVASEASRPTDTREQMDPGPLVPVFLLATVERAGGVPDAGLLAAHRALMTASFPLPAAAAVHGAIPEAGGPGAGGASRPARAYDAQDPGREGAPREPGYGR